MKQMSINNYVSDLDMNREQRRALAKVKQKWIATLPDVLTLVPEDDPTIPFSSHASDMRQVWRSKKFTVIVWDVPAGTKLSIQRNEWNPTTRRYNDGITWDEIMEIKRAIGYGDEQGIEFFPRDSEIINIANVRHLWILPDDRLINECLRLN